MQKLKISFLFIILIFISSVFAKMDDFSYAEKLFHDKYYDLAIDEYKAFMENHPHDRRIEKANYRLLNAYLEAKYYTKVIYESKFFLEKYPNSTYYSNVLYFLAKAFYEEGEYKSALSVLKSIKTNYKDCSYYIDSLFLYAEIVRKNGDEKEYISTIQDIVNMNPEYKYLKKANMVLLNYYYNKKEYKKFAFYLKKFKPSDFENGLWAWYNAQIAYNNENYKKTNIYLKKIFSLYSDTKYYFYALALKGDIAFKFKKYELALTYYKKILDKDPNCEKASYALLKEIEILEKKGEKENAVKKMEYFLTVYKNSPFFTEIINKLLGYYKDKKDIEKVKRYYTLYLSRISDEKMMTTLISDEVAYLRKEKSFDDAINVLLDNANKLKSLLPYYVFLIGRIYGDDKKDYEKAILTLNKIIYDKNYGDKALFYIGFYEEKMGKYDLAVRSYGKLKKEYPSSLYVEKAGNRILYLKNYIISDNEQGIAEFNFLLDQVLKKKITDRKLISYKRALIFYKLKNFEKAVFYFEKAGKRNEIYYRAKIYTMLLKSEKKEKIRSYIASYLPKYEKIFASIYKDILDYYDITEKLKKDDFLFYFNKFASYSKEILKAYAIFSVENNDLKIVELPEKKVKKDDITLFLKGLKFYNDANYGDAKKIFSSLVDSNFFKKEYLYYFLGAIYFKEGKLDDAESMLLKIKRAYTMKLRASVVLAKLYYMKGNFNDAEFYLYNLLQRDKSYYDDYEIVKLYLNILEKENKKEFIALILENIPENNDKLRTLKGIFYIKLGKYKKGEYLLRNIHDLSAKKEYFKYCKKREDWDKVIAFFIDNSSYSISRRIIAYIKKGNIKRARTLFTSKRKYLKQYAAEIDYYMGTYYFLKRKNLKKAKEYFDYILSHYKNSPFFDDTKLMKGNLLLSWGKKKEAEKLYNELLKETSDAELKYKTYLSLGDLNFSEEKFQIAANYFEKAYELSNTPSALYNLAVSYKKMGKIDRAKEQFILFTKKFPGDKLYYDAYLNYIYALMDLGKYDKAISLLSTLLDNAPEKYKFEIAYHIGDCYYKKEKYKDAIRAFLKVKYLHVNDSNDFQWFVTALFQAGKAYEIMNKYDKAIAIYKQIIKYSGKDTIYEKTALARIKQLKGL